MFFRQLCPPLKYYCAQQRILHRGVGSVVVGGSCEQGRKHDFRQNAVHAGGGSVLAEEQLRESRREFGEIEIRAEELRGERIVLLSGRLSGALAVRQKAPFNFKQLGASAAAAPVPTAPGRIDRRRSLVGYRNTWRALPPGILLSFQRHETLHLVAAYILNDQTGCAAVLPHSTILSGGGFRVPTFVPHRILAFTTTLRDRLCANSDPLHELRQPRPPEAVAQQSEDPVVPARDSVFFRREGLYLRQDLPRKVRLSQLHGLLPQHRALRQFFLGHFDASSRRHAARELL
mmetsp:Transcript_4871/g.12048  ORF Transcript_4871/g.12048 Transcript_4871/m.12048 type:complete len:289 (-) Transcript_4871:4299-5165(-)